MDANHASLICKWRCKIPVWQEKLDPIKEPLALEKKNYLKSDKYANILSRVGHNGMPNVKGLIKIRIEHHKPANVNDKCWNVVKIFKTWFPGRWELFSKECEIW